MISVFTQSDFTFRTNRREGQWSLTRQGICELFVSFQISKLGCFYTRPPSWPPSWARVHSKRPQTGLAEAVQPLCAALKVILSTYQTHPRLLKRYELYWKGRIFSTHTMMVLKACNKVKWCHLNKLILTLNMWCEKQTKNRTMLYYRGCLS